MKRFIAAAAALSLLGGVPAADAAKKPSKPKPPKVLKGTFAPVAADMFTYGAFGGKARLVDSKKNDKLSINGVFGLKPNTEYTWNLKERAAGENACDGTDVAAFGEGTFVTRKGGRVKARHLRSRGNGRFTVSTEKSYAVVIEEAGQTVLCAKLKGKKASKKGGAKKSPAKHAPAHGPARGKKPKA